MTPQGTADLVIVANRLPVDRVRRSDGSQGWRRSPGGLVSALEPVMRNANWTVYAVKDPTPLASGAAELVKIKPQGFILRGLRPGKATVRVRWTRYWTVERGQACLVPSEDGFTQVRVLKPGPIEVHAGFTPWRVLGGGRICSHRDLASDG